jgi:hypothetical protein
LTALNPVTRNGRPILTGRDATDVNGRAVADPFLLRIAERWYVFFEIWNIDIDRGEIAYATSDDGLSWIYGEVVLREPFHLSYPHVLEWNGNVYMIPESRQDRSVHLYVADDFPRGWRRAATLLHGAFADPTVVRYHDRWWMFAQRGLDELRLFSSRRLDGGWTPHAGNPLFAGNRTRTRPGGRILEENGRLIRPAQDGWPSYGHSLRAFEILTLSDDAYQERELDDSPLLRASRSGWNAVGMHHLDAIRRPDGSWLALVDGAAPGFF